MYYENKIEKKKERTVLIILMIVIIALLCVLIIKLEAPLQIQTKEPMYNVTKLSTNNEENVEKQSQKTIDTVVKSVVGISKLEQSGTSIFLDNFESKLGLGSGIILTDNGYILTNGHVVGSKFSNCYVTIENGK